MVKKREIIQKIEDILDDPLQEKNLELFSAEYKKEGPNQVLRILIDKKSDSPDEHVGIDECEFITRILSEELDKDDMIDNKYMLEVSSPGMDREIRMNKPSDFIKYKGKTVEVKLYEPIDNRKSFECELVGHENGEVILNLEDKELRIQDKKIAKINLAIVF